jgi:hypothetical protein
MRGETVKFPKHSSRSMFAAGGVEFYVTSELGLYETKFGRRMVES